MRNQRTVEQRKALKGNQMMKNLNNIIIAMLLALGLLALPQRAQAVSPPPDGGYPDGNTAEGQDPLLSLTTGRYNTAIGWLSLLSITTGQFNTGVGAGTLYRNTGDQNTATGAVALFNNTTGQLNTATGVFSLFSNNTGERNTADGASSLQSNTVGSYNTGVGYSALTNNTTGEYNTGVGESALSSNTTGGFNTGVGETALANNTTGEKNTAVGLGTMVFNTTGGANTAVGFHAMFVTNGHNSAAVGSEALSGNGGNGNTAMGRRALFGTGGSNNTALGFDAAANVTTASNVICLGANVTGNNVDNSCYIGNIFGATSSNGVGVFVNSNGRLGTMTSSRRFKEEIRPMEQASETLFALKPVTFRYKKEIDPEGPQGKSQFGLVAEDVENVNPDLVVRDPEGKPYSVRYEQINAMLLNEFLKEHKTMQQLNSTVQKQQEIMAEQQKSFESKLAEQEKRIQVLMSGLHKVSAQVEVSKAGPRMAVDTDTNFTNSH
jgi:trimeric autotransporter adhesin